MPETPEPRPLPAVLQGRYRLGPVLGRGGASVVLRARDQLLGRDVAVKVFTARASDPVDLAAQEAEARMLAALNHHGLVTLLDAGIDLADPDAPQVYLVLELVEDADLRTRLTAGALPPVDVAYLGFDLAGALRYVHDHGVIHRDVKPANVLLVGAGADRLRGKLADFGIALLRGSDRAEEETTGTAAYLSPEQVEGVPLTPASDVYSLGLVLLEALTGRPAYTGTVVDTALARLERDPDIPQDVPAELAALLRAMTARRPVDRPAPGQVETALRAFLVAVLAERSGTRVDEETARVAVLRRYDLLDTPPDGAFDRIASLAARLAETPIAVVGLADADRVWFKSRIGIEATELPTTGGPLLGRTMVVEDLAAGAPGPVGAAGQALGVRFFAGVPLVAASGHNLGLLAVADRRPRSITADRLGALEDLAALVVHEMELRLAVRRAVGRE